MEPQAKKQALVEGESQGESPSPTVMEKRVLRLGQIEESDDILKQIVLPAATAMEKGKVLLAEIFAKWLAEDTCQGLHHILSYIHEPSHGGGGFRRIADAVLNRLRGNNAKLWNDGSPVEFATEFVRHFQTKEVLTQQEIDAVRMIFNQEEGTFFSTFETTHLTQIGKAPDIIYQVIQSQIRLFIESGRGDRATLVNVLSLADVSTTEWRKIIEPVCRKDISRRCVKKYRNRKAFEVLNDPSAEDLAKEIADEEEFLEVFAKDLKVLRDGKIDFGDIACDHVPANLPARAPRQGRRKDRVNYHDLEEGEHDLKDLDRQKPAAQPRPAADKKLSPHIPLVLQFTAATTTKSLVRDVVKNILDNVNREFYSAAESTKRVLEPPSFPAADKHTTTVFLIRRQLQVLVETIPKAHVYHADWKGYSIAPELSQTLQKATNTPLAVRIGVVADDGSISLDPERPHFLPMGLATSVVDKYTEARRALHTELKRLATLHDIYLVSCFQATGRKNKYHFLRKFTPRTKLNDLDWCKDGSYQLIAIPRKVGSAVHLKFAPDLRYSARFFLFKKKEFTEELRKCPSTKSCDHLAEVLAKEEYTHIRTNGYELQVLEDVERINKTSTYGYRVAPDDTEGQSVERERFPKDEAIQDRKFREKCKVSGHFFPIFFI
jgi:hypothetical protein